MQPMVTYLTHRNPCGARIMHEVSMEHRIPRLRGSGLRKELNGEPEAVVCPEMCNSIPGSDDTHRTFSGGSTPKPAGDAGRCCHAAMASRWRHRDSEGALQPAFER